MTHAISPFAIKLSQLKGVIGSRSKSLLRELREEFEEELEADREEVEDANEDDSFDPELALNDALRHLIMDEERWDYEGAKYAYAIEMLCSFYGEFLANDQWSGISMEWAETVNDALLEAGMPLESFSIFGHLIYRGCPVELPEIDDFPYIGYLKLSEATAVSQLLTDEFLSGIKHQDSEEISAALRQIRDWTESCQREKADLVCFYY